MPNYKEVNESIGAGPSNIDVLYETGTPVTLSYPAGSALTPSTTQGKYFSAPSPTYRQSWKLPVEFSEDPCAPLNWYVTDYSDSADRIVYLGEDLSENLNNAYEGCCFDENGNQVSEPSLAQARVTDIVLEGVQYDVYGKMGTASGIEYKNGCTTVGMSSIRASETFTVTFNSMVPNIGGSAPYLDDDVTVTLLRSDGSSVVATSSSGTVSMSAVAPQTITIKVGGYFGKKLFPDETWEYYYEKNSEYDPNPNHLNFEIDIPERGEDPNEFIEPYRIDKDNNSGSVVDLSLEVPEGVSLLKYESDRTEREAGINPIEGSTSRAGHRDIVFNFTTTSSVPAITYVTWGIGVSLSVGDYVLMGGSTYHVDVGGTVSGGTPGSPGDPTAVPPVPSTPGTPADTGPSGSGFFVDESGITYRYIPPEGVLTSIGAGTWSTTLYVMNDYLVGQTRFEELLDAAVARRVK